MKIEIRARGHDGVGFLCAGDHSGCGVIKRLIENLEIENFGLTM